MIYSKQQVFWSGLLECSLQIVKSPKPLFYIAVCLFFDSASHELYFETFFRSFLSESGAAPSSSAAPSGGVRSGEQPPRAPLSSPTELAALLPVCQHAGGGALSPPRRGSLASDTAEVRGAMRQQWCVPTATPRAEPVLGRLSVSPPPSGKAQHRHP